MTSARPCLKIIIMLPHLSLYTFLIISSLSRALALAPIVSVSTVLAFGGNRTTAHQHQVRKVPGFPGPLPSNQYAGYVSVSNKNKRRLFYYFVTAESSPYIAPLVLWLAGGPSCSSVGFGFVHQHGPFRFQFRGERRQSFALRRNPHSWSKVANMLYLDNQPGVGFSYSMTESDYKANTGRLVNDVINFLDLFFEEYKEFSANRFYLAGDGYAGILIPRIAKIILDRNEQGRKILNLKGYLLGNPFTDPISEFAQMPVLAAQRSLLPPSFADTLQQACGNKLRESKQITDAVCRDTLETMWKMLRGVSPYNVLEDCWTMHSTTETKGMVSSYPFTVREVLSRVWPWQTPWLGDSNASSSASVSSTKQFSFSAGIGGTRPLKGSLPCVESRIAPSWFNTAEVRKQLHATVQGKLNTFQMCSTQGTLTKTEGSMVQLHKELVSRDLRVLIYSGDQDLVVPYLSTYEWIRSLDLPMLHNWTNWWYHTGQTGGFLVQYEGLMFATIKGAGHMAAASEPHKALTLFARFVSGKPVVTTTKPLP